MSWINSNATYKQNSKNDLSFYHGFSKTPVEPTSTGTAATTLANASTKGGHTVIGTEVWAEEIPWFGLVASRAAAVTRLSGLTKLNDLVKVDGEGGKVYKYKGADDATFTEDTWADFWEEVTLTNGMTLNNRHNQPVLRYYLNQPMQTLTTTNNASIDSKGFATRLFVNEENHTGQTSGGSVVSQFAAGTDNIKNGIPSVELNPKLYLGTTEKIAGTHYYDYNVSGTILWSTAVTSSSPKISCFRYIGKTVTGQLATIDSAVTTHSNEISEIKDKLGLGDTGTEGTPTLGSRVTDNETALRILLGLEGDAKVVATESISNSISAAEGRVKVTTDALAGRIAQLEGITHFSVAVVDALPSILVENTIYLVPEEDKTSGNYVEYIAYKPESSETVTTERIGTTAIDLEGYTTDAEHTALANRVTALDAATTGRVAVVEGKVKTLEETTVPAAITTAQGYTDTKIAEELETGGSIATAINAAKEAAIANAKVTLTAGTGITIPNSGEQDTAFTVSVDTSVIATKKSVDDLSDVVSGVSQTVASNKTDLEGQITTAQTTLQGSIDGVSGRVTTLETVTVPGIDTRLQTAEATITSLTTGDTSVDSKVNAAKTELQGKIDEINTSLTTGDIHTEIDGVRQTANAAKATADTAVQTVSKSGSSTLLTVTQTGTAVTVGLSDTVATKDYADTAASTAITTGLAEVGSIAQAIATAKSGAEQTAATNLATARGEITTEISTAVNGLETKLTTGEGSLGGRVTALETATGTTLPAAIEQALTDAKAYSDSLHTTSLDYVVLGDSESLPTASAETLGKIYLVASQNAPTTDGSAISGAYVEYMTRKVGEGETATYTWEKIGTTAADLSAYAKSADLNVDETTVNGLTYSQTDGVVSVSVEQASTSQVGTVQLDNTIEGSTSETTAATPKAVKEYAQKALTVKDERGNSATENDLWGTTATLDSDGNLTIAHNWVTNPNAYVSQSMAWNSSITKVEDNKAYVGDEFFANIQTERIKNGRLMFYDSQLSQFSSDLSSLTNAYYMFNYCSNITTFSSDLSSLTDGSGMFNSCSNLKSFTSDLSSLTDGYYMFFHCNKLESFCGDLSSLTSGNNMFGASNLVSFCGDLSSLTNGRGMFSGCSQLTSFTSDLSSLTNGRGMFSGCKLNTESVECIADTINDVKSLTNDDVVTKWIDIGIGNTEPNGEEDAAFTQMYDKGWDVYVNGSATYYVPVTGEASLNETGETTVAPKPYWAKPIEVTEDKAEYVGQDGKFYQVVGGQFIYVSDPETYGMFVSREDAIANMKLTKYEKPVEEA